MNKINIIKSSLAILGVSLTVVIAALFVISSAYAEEPVKETVKIAQVGTSGGIPAIKASVQNGSDTGTYSIVITNPKTNTSFNQVLSSSGKETTFAITNFTENGTYPYTLQVNGLELLEGGINLTSTKRTPTFVAQLNGTDLTIDVTGGVDFAGQTIFFKSGSYSNSLVLSGDAVQRAFPNAKGLDSKITFSSEKGNLVTVDVKKVGGSNSGGTTSSSGGSTLPPSNTGNTSNPGANGNNSGGSSSGTVGGKPSLNNQKPSGQTSSTKRQITVSLNQKTFKLEQTIVATVNVVNTDYAGRSITVRLGADDNSTVALLDLDKQGRGSSTFKILVPQPSSKVITATAYSIAGSQLDSTSAKYTITNETSGTSTKDDGDFSADVPSAKYVSLDLSNLNKQKAILAWYEGRNIYKYSTKLKVINTTTHDEHIYTVFMPDGDSKIDMNLVYDGPGIYTWELHSGGKLVAQAPYSTPLGVNGTPVSNNGLPVLKTLANKDVYMSNLEGTDPNGVNGATIGEEIGGVTADDVSGQQFEEPFNPEQQTSKKKLYMIWGLVVFLVIVFVVLFIIYQRKKNSLEDEEGSGFVKYEPEEKVHTKEEEEPEFEEVK